MNILYFYKCIIFYIYLIPEMYLRSCLTTLMRSFVEIVLLQTSLCTLHNFLLSSSQMRFGSIKSKQTTKYHPYGLLW